MTQEDIPRLYYSISEVADLLQEKPHVLRYWETEFPSLHPKKNRAGKRTYTRGDIETLRHIQRLLREEGYTIAGARKALSEAPAGADQAEAAALREELINLRAFLSKLLKSLPDNR